MTENSATLKRLILESGVEEARIHVLNEREPAGGLYVLYWMRNSHRASMNPSLNFAVDTANSLGLPVVVFCGLNSRHHGGYVRQCSFMLEGLQEVRRELEKKGIAFVLRTGEPVSGLNGISGDAAVVVADAGYLKSEREEEASAASILCRPMVAVESRVIVPLGALPAREEYAASTLRPKIKKILHAYLDPRPDPEVKKSSLHIRLESEDLIPGDLLLKKIFADESVPAVPGLRGGTSSARKLLAGFIEKKLRAYNEQRNDPDLDATSRLSPFLHFGHISPVETALAVVDSGDLNADKFLDELIVRRELAFNFVRYNDDYDNIRSIQTWAYDSLMLHKDDTRDYAYSRGEFENSRTHDRYWNAAQNQLVAEGTIHNYMRMYWGKKIIEWSRSPEEAYGHMVYLNNKYALDGCDPNSYAGIAWCFGKHDRPWSSRRIFGKVRYMNDRGLERKFSMKRYLEKYKDAGK